MGIKEIFSFPTVKQVIFQIRYPNLFIIENKIGVELIMESKMEEKCVILNIIYLLIDI